MGRRANDSGNEQSRFGRDPRLLQDFPENRIAHPHGLWILFAASMPKGFEAKNEEEITEEIVRDITVELEQRESKPAISAKLELPGRSTRRK